MKLLKTSLYVSVVLSAGLVACSDSSTPNDVAGGVTDIGNSLAYSGQVVDASGANVASARVVAYYDSWDNVSALDSVVTMTDENGKFEIKVDSGASFVLYASHDDECGFSKLNPSPDAQEITIGSKMSISSSVNGKNSGFMRVVGSDERAPLDVNGSFTFGAVPPGDISLVYVEHEKPQARIDFRASGIQNGLAIPTLDTWSLNKTWLTINDPRFYHDPAYAGFNVYVPEGFEIPAMPPDTTAKDTVPPDTTKPEPDTSVIDTAENLAIQIQLHMDGDAKVYNNDMTVADSVNYVEGVSGKGILLAPGQFIDLGNIDPCAGDFTMSIWTKWNGPATGEFQNGGFQGMEDPRDSNQVGAFQGDSSQAGPFQGGYQGGYPGGYQGNPYGGYQGIPYQTGTYQILFSLRSYWSDSTSRFQMQYDWTSKSLTVVSNGLDLSTGYAWLVKADTEFGGMLPTDAWTFLTLVYKEGKLYFYVNAELVSANVGIPFVPSAVSEPVPFRIGGTEIASDTWNGVLDEVRIESTARSEEWIRRQFMANSPKEGDRPYPRK